MALTSGIYQVRDSHADNNLIVVPQTASSSTTEKCRLSPTTRRSSSQEKSGPSSRLVCLVGSCFPSIQQREDSRCQKAEKILNGTCHQEKGP